MALEAKTPHELTQADWAFDVLAKAKRVARRHFPSWGALLDDAVQEVMIKALRTEVEHLDAWLWHSLRGALVDLGRRERRQSRDALPLDDFQTQATESPDLDANAAKWEALDRLWRERPRLYEMVTDIARIPVTRYSNAKAYSICVDMVAGLHGISKSRLRGYLAEARGLLRQWSK